MRSSLLGYPGPAIALAAVLLLLGACGKGGDDSQNEALPAPPVLEGQEEAVAAAVKAAAEAAHPKRGASLRHYARVLQAHDFPAEAVHIYERAARLNRDGWCDLYLAGRSLVKDDPERSREFLERARTLNPEYQPTHLWLGHFYLESKEYDAALGAYQKAMTLGASSFAHIGIARVFMSEGPKRNLRLAQSQLEQARSLGRRIPEVYAAYADYYRQIGNGPQRVGMERLARDQVVRLGFPDPLMREVALLSRSRVGLRRQIEGLVEVGDFDLALERANRMLADHPELDDARHFKANVLLRLSRFEEVIAIADDLLTRRPEDQDVMVLRANALHGLGREEESVDQLRRSYEIGEAHVATRYTYGVILGPLDAAAAIDHLKWTLTTAPLRHPESRLALSRIYEVLGQKNEAIQMVKDALSFDSTDDLARQRLAQLGG